MAYKGITGSILNAPSAIVKPISDYFKSDEFKEDMKNFNVKIEKDFSSAFESISEGVNAILSIPASLFSDVVDYLTSDFPVVSDIFQGIKESINEIKSKYWEKPDIVCPEGDLSFEIPTLLPLKTNICISEQTAKKMLENPNKALRSAIDCGITNYITEPFTTLTNNIAKIADNIKTFSEKNNLNVKEVTKNIINAGYEFGRLTVPFGPNRLNEFAACVIDKMK